MARSFSEIMHSELFTFLIGQDEEPVVVHLGAIAALSPSLDCLVNGSMKEALENIARLPELEVEDFERICEFAYRDNYTDPEPDIIDDTDDNNSTLLSPSIAQIVITGGISRQYVHTFITLGFGQWSAARAVISPWSGQEHWEVDVSDVLMAHARLYTFAEKYMIYKLKHLALHRLHQFLVSLPVNTLTRAAVVDLLVFVYDNNNTADRIYNSEHEHEAVDPLRNLVVKFMLIHLDAFRGFPEYRKFMEQGGQYAIDLQDDFVQWRGLVCVT
ncbi:hypothetical protein P153DRAFT_394293 [Dothidotthia symphoricarpi CBS 119687]|uniref:BTB domain-containing protein n=1 Tax=Dothidotthia symphoricarpi CBS 119687 TaxID=1392245 RepID=A0A6A6AJH2_9PLEO|nr:uncharacterized protein P153DRAFT_394293 [Dothidotthia symphoricarpi CBS 119687]KAF2132122.1 hypothetical protein P153DRAFT_394293 [Dothidotthia symphoricarpi CBS 119687]